MQSTNYYVLDLLLNGKKGLHVTGKYNELKQFSRKNSEYNLPCPWIEHLLTRYIKHSLLLKNHQITTPTQVYEQVPFAKLSHDMNRAWAQNYYYYYDQDEDEDISAPPAKILDKINFQQGYMDMCEKLTTIQYIWEALYKNDSSPLRDTTSMYEAFKRKGNTDDRLQITLALILSRIFRAQFCLQPPSNNERESEMKKLVATLQVDFPYIFQELQDRGKAIFELPAWNEGFKHMIVPFIAAGTFVIPLIMDFMANMEIHHRTLLQLSAVPLAIANASLISQYRTVDISQQVLMCLNFLVDAYYHHYFERGQPSVPVTRKILMLYYAAHFLLTLLFIYLPVSKARVETRSLLSLSVTTYLPVLASFYFSDLHIQNNANQLLIVHKVVDFVKSSGVRPLALQPGVATSSLSLPFMMAIGTYSQQLSFQMERAFSNFITSSNSAKEQIALMTEAQTEFHKIISNAVKDSNEVVYLSSLAEFLFGFVMEKAFVMDPTHHLAQDTQILPLFEKYSTMIEIAPHIKQYIVKHMHIAIVYMQYLFMDVLSSTPVQPFVRFVDHTHLDKTLTLSKVFLHLASHILKLIAKNKCTPIEKWIEKLSVPNRQIIEKLELPTLYKLPHPALFAKNDGTLKDLLNATITKAQIEKLSDTEYELLRPHMATFYDVAKTDVLGKYLQPNLDTMKRGEALNYIFPAILLYITRHNHVLMDTIKNHFDSVTSQQQEGVFQKAADLVDQHDVDTAYALAALKLPNLFIENSLNHIHESILKEFALADKGLHRAKAKALFNYSPPFRLMSDLLSLSSQKLQVEILRLSHRIYPMPVKDINDFRSNIINTTTVRDNQMTLINLSIQKHPYFWLHTEVDPSAKGASMAKIHHMVQHRTAYAAYHGIFAFPTPNNVLSLLQPEMEPLLKQLYAANNDIFLYMLIQSMSQIALLRSWQTYWERKFFPQNHMGSKNHIKQKEDQLRGIFHTGKVVLKITPEHMKRFGSFLYDYFKLYDHIPTETDIPVNHRESRFYFDLGENRKEDPNPQHQHFAAGPPDVYNRWGIVDPQFYKASPREMFAHLDLGSIDCSRAVLHDVYRLVFSENQD